MTKTRRVLPETAIRARSREMGLSMRELAKRLEITEGHLANIARGRVRVRKEIAAKTAQILQRKIVDLFPPAALLEPEESQRQRRTKKA